MRIQKVNVYFAVVNSLIFIGLYLLLMLHYNCKVILNNHYSNELLQKSESSNEFLTKNTIFKHRTIVLTASSDSKLYSPLIFERPIKTILVTGGAGFIGSHLVARLLKLGYRVIVIDNFMTGRHDNMIVLKQQFNEQLQIYDYDITEPIYLEEELNLIYHLASPASPKVYLNNQIKTIKTNFLGTLHMLEMAHKFKARILFASSSEVYGDPIEHPQKETYWGNVNPIGSRSCYDEGKRSAEALIYAFMREKNVDIRVARIFNTYGPLMTIDDGRMISNFIIKALQNQPLNIYGNGNHTRSLQFVSDLVDGMIQLMQSSITSPVNLGNPSEMSVHDIALLIIKLTNSNSTVNYFEEMDDDPQRRKPDIGKAKKLLKWTPKVVLKDGLIETIEYFRKVINNSI